ncbi:histone deacetylase [Trichuris trichiura]|uniref:Histone deacetylase n=1 Tax=Trichuris trichiura TaxID=36087 RepID=A0A077YVJ6_TRITR|nr:histone deacetylase [Trichuris trichiura]
MKPRRIGMTHDLVMNYGLYRDIAVYRPRRATVAEMARFHAKDYLESMKTLCPVPEDMLSEKATRYNLHGDCPIFAGMNTFSSISAGGTLGCAYMLNTRQADIAINWAGGLHHAKKAEASGFCYVNDVVLGILELLKYHERVLYVDIDCHHGDGVEEAFYATDRVLTVSFHQYGDFFPYSGSLKAIIHQMHSIFKSLFAVNVPFRSGINDDAYVAVFEPVITHVVRRFQPDVIVLQCGADSLAGDRLGGLNLTLKGHGQCVDFIRKLNIPLLMLGGGGYTIRNVARCWANETAIAVGRQLPNHLPPGLYYEHYAPNYQLHISPLDIRNNNTDDYLNDVTAQVLENIESIQIAPSAPIHTVEEDLFIAFSDTDACDLEMATADQRLPAHETDRMIEHPAEFYNEIGDDNGGQYMPYMPTREVTSSSPGHASPTTKRFKAAEEDEHH